VIASQQILTPRYEVVRWVSSLGLGFFYHPRTATEDYLILSTATGLEPTGVKKRTCTATGLEPTGVRFQPVRFLVPRAAITGRPAPAHGTNSKPKMQFLRLSVACLLGLISGSCGAFTSRAAVAAGRQVQRASLITASIAAAADDAAAERLWSSAGKPLLRIGKHGAKPSHATGLADLCDNQQFVCVRFTGPRTDESLDSLVELIASTELASGPEGAPVFLCRRKPRRGGVEALFARPARVEDVCSAAFHEALAAAEEAKDLEAR
jgi:hypothetical protein